MPQQAAPFVEVSDALLGGLPTKRSAAVNPNEPRPDPLLTVDWHFQSDRNPETQDPYDCDSALIVCELTARETLSTALFDRRAVFVELGDDIVRAELD